MSGRIGTLSQGANRQGKTSSTSALAAPSLTFSARAQNESKSHIYSAQPVDKANIKKQS